MNEALYFVLLIYFTTDQPEGVQIERPTPDHIVGKTSVLTCKSWGARPAAFLTWWIDGTQLLLGSSEDMVRNNVMLYLN